MGNGFGSVGGGGSIWQEGRARVREAAFSSAGLPGRWTPSRRPGRALRVNRRTTVWTTPCGRSRRHVVQSEVRPLMPRRADLEQEQVVEGGQDGVKDTGRASQASQSVLYLWERAVL